jgi:hypothetical protein
VSFGKIPGEEKSIGLFKEQQASIVAHKKTEAQELRRNTSKRNKGMKAHAKALKDNIVKKKQK